MKLGIITITQGTNYGNRLQVYAVQQVLKKLGHESALLLNNTGVNSATHGIKMAIKLTLGLKQSREEFARKRSYDRFDRKYLTIDRKALDESYRKADVGSRYDAFVCGSDQVWNPHTPYMNGIFFADFPDVKKRISYAASFGVNEIPEKFRQKYADWIGAFDAISVREESGRELVRQLCGRGAAVLVDPTMMLDAREWMQIEEKPAHLPEGKYIFKYFLGKMDTRVEAFVEKTAKEKGLDIIDVLPEKKEKNYRLNPSHFVYLLHHSELVVTDSFHAVVFSMLFNKPLRVFDRVHRGINMSTRLDTLLPYFGLTHCRNNFEDWDMKSVNYDLHDKLEARRRESEAFLRDALEA